MSDPAALFERSPSGHSMTCRACGTIYDTSSSYDLNAIPPVGDGCDACQPPEELEAFLAEQGIA